MKTSENTRGHPPWFCNPRALKMTSEVFITRYKSHQTQQHQERESPSQRHPASCFSPYTVYDVAMGGIWFSFLRGVHDHSALFFDSTISRSSHGGRLLHPLLLLVYWTGARCSYRDPLFPSPPRIMTRLGYHDPFAMPQYSTPPVVEYAW